MKYIFILFITLTFSCRNNDIELPENLWQPTQEELDQFKDQIQELQIWTGNIYIDGEFISDFSAFENIKEITGALTLFNLNEDFSQIFPNLKKIDSNEATGDGLLITSNTESIDLGNVEIICGNFLLPNSETMLNFVAPNLKEVQGFFSITDNQNLSLISLPKLEYAFEMVIQRNGAELNIADVSNLSRIEIDLDIQNETLLTSSNTFINLNQVGNRIFILTQNEGSDFLWLENINSCPEIRITGPVQGADFCMLKSFAELELGNILISSNEVFQSWGNNWLINNCP